MPGSACWKSTRGRREKARARGGFGERSSLLLLHATLAMTHSRKIEMSLFEAARDLDDAGLRAEFLEQTCQGNAALRQRLEKLLTLDAPAEEFFSSAGRGAGERD